MCDVCCDVEKEDDENGSIRKAFEQGHISEEEFKKQLEEELRDFYQKKMKNRRVDSIVNQIDKKVKEELGYKSPTLSLLKEDDKKKYLSEDECQKVIKEVFEIHKWQEDLLKNFFDKTWYEETYDEQRSALIQEYLVKEKLKMVLVDRVNSNLHEKHLGFNNTNFSGNNN